MKWTHLLVGVACLGFPALAASDLPELGEAAQGVFSPQLERKVGEAIMRDIRADRAYLDDPEIADYLNAMGYRLAAASPNNRQDFEFFAVQDGTLNAFALPGGYIGVHTGLITAAQTESELAAVLAHEIAHVTQRHVARMVAQQSRNNLLSVAAMALAILVARSNSQVGAAASAAAQAAQIQSALDFTRENEREADRVGLSILQDAGFDPRGMADFFDRLSKFNRLYENSAPSYLRTHPLTVERLSDIQNRVADMPYRQIPDSLDFQFIRARLLARQATPQEAIASFEAALKDKRFAHEAAQRYGFVVALGRAKQYARAERELSALRQTMGMPHPALEAEAAELKAIQGQEAAALGLYETALKAFPNYRRLVYGYAELLLRTRRNSEALNFVNEQLRVRSNDARLYQLQAQTYAALGQRFLTHRATAEAYVRRGNLVAAIEQLQIALKTGEGDFYQLSSAEARLRELRALDAENRKQ